MTMDSVTYFPATDYGHDAIYIVVDRLSKLMYFTPCNHTVSAANLAYLLLTNVVAHHGMPASTVSDCDLWFTSYFWHSLISALGCNYSLSTALQPEMGGLSERMHRSIE